MADDDAKAKRAVELWQTLDDPRAQQILRDLAANPEADTSQAAEYLRRMAERADAPPELSTIVKGGNVEKIIQIARLEGPLEILVNRGTDGPAPRSLESLLAVPLDPQGCLPTVDKLSIYDIGVSRSKYSAAASPYVPRNVDGELDQALLNEPFILLVGSSKSGKSRTALEALRRSLPGAGFIVPIGDASAPNELARIEIPSCEQTTAVVWLDDLDRYLTPRGLDLRALDQFARSSPRKVVVATIRSGRRDALLATEGDTGRTARLVLERGVVIGLPRLLKPDEKIAAKKRYPKENFDGRGIGEQLVAAPLLEQRYSDSYDSAPEGWAVIQAAIDWRRVGLERPIPEGALRHMYGLYLAEARPDLDPSDDLFNKGVQWARSAVAGNVALLYAVPNGDQREYRAFDYIVEFADGTDPENLAAVPTLMWESVGDYVDTVDLLGVAFEALTRKELQAARKAAASCLESGDEDVSPRGALLLLEIESEAGDAIVAKDFYERAIKSRDHDVVSVAHLDYGVALLNAGRLVEAQPFFEQARASSNPDLNALAKVNLGALLFQDGKLDESRTLLEEAMGTGDPEVQLYATVNLGALLLTTGDLDAAQGFLEKVSSARGRQASLAKANLGTLFFNQGRLDEARPLLEVAAESDNPLASALAKVSLGALLISQGESSRGTELVEQAIDSGSRQVVPVAKAVMGGQLLTQGLFDKARTLLEDVLDSGNQLAAGSARVSLSALHAQRGELTRARELLEEVVASGNSRVVPMAKAGLGALLLNEGDLARARVLLDEAVASGNPLAVPVAEANLGALLMNQGDLDGARAVLERVVASANPQAGPLAKANLGALLIRKGDPDAARTLLEDAIASGSSDAVAVGQANLGSLFFNEGNFDRARELFEKAVASGNAMAMPMAKASLGGLLFIKGEYEPARDLLEEVVASGNQAASLMAKANLGSLLLIAGELDRARSLLEEVVASGNQFSGPMAAVNLAAILIREEGDHSRAQALLEQAISSGDGQAAALAKTNLGALLYQDGVELDRGIGLLEEAVASGNLQAASIASVTLGAVLMARGEFDRARQLLEAALASGNPQAVPPATFNLGVLLFNQGELDAARPYLEAAAAINHPDQPRAADLLGDLLSQQGNADGAAAAYQLAIDSGHPQWSMIARVDLALVEWERGATDRARALLELVANSESSEEARAAGLLGLLAEEQGAPVEAQERYQSAIDKGNGEWSMEARIHLSKLVVDEEPARAEELLDAVLASDQSQRPQAAALLGFLRGQLGNSTGAQEACQIAIDSDEPPWSILGRMQLALLVWEQGELEQAAVLLRQVVASDHPDRLGAAGLLGDLLAVSGDPTGAEAAYRLTADSTDAELADAAKARLADLTGVVDAGAGRTADRKQEVARARETFWN